VRRRHIGPNVQPAPDSSFAFAAVLLAAGRSRRMGRSKVLLPWGDTSILGCLVRQWQQLGAVQLAVVHASDDSAVRDELRRVGFPPNDCIGNPHPDEGMFSSVQCAARWAGWKQTLTHWCLVLGDQPHLLRETLVGLVAGARRWPDAVCQPASGGRARHPVLLPKPVFVQLASSHAPDLKAFLDAFPVKLFEANDPGLELDIDRPGDYQRVLGMAGKKGEMER
jgi:molybdenum cofactor cytidylyltransferase